MLSRNNKFHITFLGLVFLLFLSCSQRININEYIDESEPMELVVKTNGNSMGQQLIRRELIQVNSLQQRMILDWTNGNSTNWHTTPASYSLNVFVGQGNFRLLYNIGSDFVIIGFNNKSNQTMQYIKNIEKGELDFLGK
jgi:hypothetical protein